MNPELLLHKTAVLLHAEAELGPGTIFVVGDKDNVDVTRTPAGEDVKKIIARYDCTEFCVGLSSKQWASLLKELWAACKPEPKGATSGQQPAKPAQTNKP